jgi:hypothetical protein
LYAVARATACLVVIFSAEFLVPFLVDYIIDLIVGFFFKVVPGAPKPAAQAGQGE